MTRDDLFNTNASIVQKLSEAAAKYDCHYLFGSFVANFCSVVDLCVFLITLPSWWKTLSGFL